jgi:alanine dehydrogenase
MKSNIHEHQKNNAISMSKKLIYVSLLLFSFVSFAQTRFVTREIPAGQTIELKDKKMFINNEQIPSYEIKKYLKDNDYKAYTLYNKAKNKSVFGGLLLGLGSVLIVSDAVKAIVTEGGQFPTAIAASGAVLVGTSIFVLKGKNKKLQEAVDTYNNGLKTTSELENNFEANLNLVANQNGLGLRLSF